MPSRSFFVLRLLALFLAFARGAWAQDPEAIEMKTIAGLRFDPPRFVVKPGAKVKVEIENIDDMAHNFVLVAPGARLEVVNAAMTMPITPEQTFIPESAKILQHTPVLVPGKSATIEFTAPAEDGVYPYVCTYPGHGLVMFGAMYVSKRGEQELPLVADDENLPDMIREQAKNAALHAYPTEPPFWYRTFMRDSGPASIAVALPGGQNYCWDAGACRLRYVWRGAFLDPMPHWRGNGDAFAEVKGTIYYRPETFPLRFGDGKKPPPEIRFRGFDVVEGLPEFRYEIGGIAVRERISAQHHGGIVSTFKITGAKGAVSFVSEPGAGVKFESDAGKFVDGVLKVPAAKLKQFQVTCTEIPNYEAIGYWSMNDHLLEKKPLPVEGVKGRALVFDGKKSQVATHLPSDLLTSGASFSIWAKLTKPPEPDQVCIGAKNDVGEFALGANLAGVPGYGVRVKSANQEAKIIAAMPLEADAEWHHLAATLQAKGLRFYLDGKPSGFATAAPLPAAAEFFLGSVGSAHFAGATLDEARIFARVLDAKEIAAIYENERPKPGAILDLKAPTPDAAASVKPAATPAPTKPPRRGGPKLPTSATPKPVANATPKPKSAAAEKTTEKSADKTPTKKAAATPKPAAKPAAKTPAKTDR